MDYQCLEKGFEGEKLIRDLLTKKNHEYGQIDIISIDKKTSKIYLWEIKYQERFKAPPFDGHGLPPWQFRFRLKVARRTGTNPIFCVVEPEVNEEGKRAVYFQSLFVLEKLPSENVFLSKTGKRIIFKIDAFKRFFL